MAPKRKRAVPVRPISGRSSFVDCPACQVKVISCFINHHLDHDCMALWNANEQLHCKASNDEVAADVENSIDEECQVLEDEGCQLEKVERECHTCICNEASPNRLEFLKNKGICESNYPSSVSDVSVENLDSGSHTSTSSLYKEWSFMRSSSLLKAPKGHHVVEDFISLEEEHMLISVLDADSKNPWKLSTFNGLHMSKAYGVVTDLKRRCVRPAIYEMPKELQPILERMRNTVFALRDFFPNETNAIDYCKDKGHWLKPHVDDRQLSGTVLVNLSLCRVCKMTYEREKGVRELYKILLKPRSIQVLTGECRYNFTHRIENQDLLAPRRISMTFRQSVYA